jgi:hypothetical protein
MRRLVVTIAAAAALFAVGYAHGRAQLQYPCTPDENIVDGPAVSYGAQTGLVRGWTDVELLCQRIRLPSALNPCNF